MLVLGATGAKKKGAHYKDGAPSVDETEEEIGTTAAVATTGCKAVCMVYTSGFLNHYGGLPSTKRRCSSSVEYPSWAYHMCVAG